MMNISFSTVLQILLSVIGTLILIHFNNLNKRIDELTLKVEKFTDENKNLYDEIVDLKLLVRAHDVIINKKDEHTNIQ